MASAASTPHAGQLAPGGRKSRVVWWPLRPKAEMSSRRGLRPGSAAPGGEPALRAALLRPRGRGCRAVGQRASGTGVPWARRGGGFPQGRTEDRDCVREPSLARKFKSTGAGPPRACLRSGGRQSLSLARTGRCVAGGLGERAPPALPDPAQCRKRQASVPPRVTSVSSPPAPGAG